jgi:hypothetical protein
VADRVYPDPRLRPFRDLDFVLPAGDLARAAAALTREFGYRRLEEPWPGYGELHGHHAALGRQAGAAALVVELHWRITTDPAARRLDHAFLARASQPLPLDAVTVRVPGPSAQLLVLACHLLHEGEKRLLWINDLNLAARAASEEDWEAGFAAADELGLTWVLHRALDYPQQYLDLNRPRPNAAGSPPPWGPLRANETFDGWLAAQVGQLSLGGWTGKDGYLRSALRARRRMLRARLRRRGVANGSGPG